MIFVQRVSSEFSDCWNMEWSMKSRKDTKSSIQLVVDKFVISKDTNHVWFDYWVKNTAWSSVFNLNQILLKKLNPIIRGNKILGKGRVWGSFG